jgi:hypothetical protein
MSRTFFQKKFSPNLFFQRKAEKKMEAVETVKEFLIETNGSSLAELAAVEGINWRQATTNNVHEVNQTLGIEAAASTLFAELMIVLTSDGYINPRHPMLLTDTMTRRGWLMPMSRFGINRVGDGPLTKSAFEETSDTLFCAAAYAETQKCTGVTSNVMIGATCDAGTGHVVTLPDPEYKALLDEEFENKKTHQVVQTKVHETLVHEPLVLEKEKEEKEEEDNWMEEDVEITENDLQMLLAVTDMTLDEGQKDALLKSLQSEKPSGPPVPLHVHFDPAPPLPVEIPISKFELPLGVGVPELVEQWVKPAKAAIASSVIEMSTGAKNQCNIFYGGDGDGNILKERNIREFCHWVAGHDQWKPGRAHLVTGDGGIEADDLNKQEAECAKLLMSELLLAALNTVQGGSAVLKVFDLFSETSAVMVMLACHWFEKVELIKPFSSRPCSSEKFLVMRGRRPALSPVATEHAPWDLFRFKETHEAISSWTETTVFQTIVDFITGKEEIDMWFELVPDALLDSLDAWNTQFCEFQTRHLDAAVAMTREIVERNSQGLNSLLPSPSFADVAFQLKKMHKADTTALEHATFFCLAHEIPLKKSKDISFCERTFCKGTFARSQHDLFVIGGFVDDDHGFLDGLFLFLFFGHGGRRKTFKEMRLLLGFDHPQDVENLFRMLVPGEPFVAHDSLFQAVALISEKVFVPPAFKVAVHGHGDKGRAFQHESEIMVGEMLALKLGDALVKIRVQPVQKQPRLRKQGFSVPFLKHA